MVILYFKKIDGDICISSSAIVCDKDAPEDVFIIGKVEEQSLGDDVGKILHDVAIVQSSIKQGNCYTLLSNYGSNCDCKVVKKASELFLKKIALLNQLAI